MEGVVFMTLRNLINLLGIYISYPQQLGDIEIKNESDFCRYPMIGYFVSDEFQVDMQTCENEFYNNSYNGVKFYFLFHRDPLQGDFWLELVHET